jgi:hypothetical protein
MHTAISRTALLCLLVAANAALARQPGCAALAFDDNGKAPWAAHPRVVGVFIQYLVGKPSDPGFFKYRLQFPPGFDLPAHSHSNDLAMSVLCGNMRIRISEGPSLGAPRTLSIAAAAYYPAGSVHAEASPDGAVIEVTGIGPMSTQMLVPADPPSN